MYAWVLRGVGQYMRPQQAGAATNKQSARTANTASSISDALRTQIIRQKNATSTKSTKASAPAMCMRLTGIGSQYLMNNVDASGIPLDGGNTYRLDLPKNIPAERFWSLTIYNMQTRSIIQTDQEFPRAGSQSFPSPAAQENKDGSVSIYYGPEKPKGVSEGNWIQTKPNEGWFQLLRCYSPGKSFFDKTWRPGKLELVK